MWRNYWRQTIFESICRICRKVWRYPIRRPVTKTSALEYLINPEESCIAAVVIKLQKKICLISKKAMKVYQDLELWSSVDDGTTYTTSKAYMLHVFSIVRHCVERQLNLSSAYNLCKLSGPRSGLTECRSWSGSKLFDTMIVFLK